MPENCCRRELTGKKRHGSILDLNEQSSVLEIPGPIDSRQGEGVMKQYLWLGVLVVLGLVFGFAGSAPAVTFATADLAGRWSLQSLGMEGVVGTKYTGIIEFNATGSVIGGTAAPDWEIGFFTGGALFVNPDGQVLGTIEGTTDSGVYPLLIKQGAMHLTKDQITLTASGNRAYNHLLVLVKIKEEAEADYTDSDLDGIWEFHAHAYYDIHADFNYGQIIVSNGNITGSGSQHSAPCTYNGILALADSAPGAVLGRVNGTWEDLRPGEAEPSKISFSWQLSSAQLNHAKDVIAATGFNSKGYFAIIFLVKIQ